MSMPVYLALSILELSERVIYGFWYGYQKPRYYEKLKLDRQRHGYGYRQFRCFDKKDDICKDIAEDVKTRFNTSNYELDRLYSKVKNKKVIGLMKDELSGKTIKELVGLTANNLYLFNR